MDNNRPCSVIRSFDVIGSKWKLIIINDLQNGEKRFNELKRSTDASSRTLSRVLDELIEEDIVSKRVEDEAPVASYYSLTEKGIDLFPVLEMIDEWGSKWLDL